MNPQLASGKLTKKTLYHIHWIGLRKKTDRKTRYFMVKTMVSGEDFP